MSNHLAMDYRPYREFFRALSNPARFSIVQLLRKRPYYVGELVEKLNLEQSLVSHNLRCLLHCGFVQWEWNSKNKVYSLNPGVVPVLKGIEEHLGRYAPELENCCILESESARTSRNRLKVAEKKAGKKLARTMMR